MPGRIRSIFRPKIRGGAAIGGPGVRVVFHLSPSWNILARIFSRVSKEHLQREMLEMASAIGREMLNQIHIHASPLDYTGRLSDTRTGMTWRLFVGRPREITYATVKLHQPQEVPIDIGRSTLIYAACIEKGSRPPVRGFYKAARLRFEHWAQVQGIDRRSVRYIMAAIYKHGTRPHPYFEPAARATERAAEGWASTYGFRWRDGVEAELKAGF